jgi:UDP-N-acetylmuramoylalanine--D-glutamate ligase
MIRVTTFAGKTVAVFGLARSGIVSAQALIAGGATVACWDDGAPGRAAAEKAGLSLVDLATADWSQFAALILSPGVPLTHPKPHWTVEKAKAANVEIIGDVELFFRERAKVCPDSPVIAITGTNGKSTTTALIAHILREAGRDVQMGGNIGIGILALEPPAKDRFHVIEMSSYQIDLTPTLNPTVGVLLNVTPDHLDRHGTLENYAAVKLRLPLGATEAVIGLDDDWCLAARNLVEQQAKAVIAVSTKNPALRHGISVDGTTLRWRQDGHVRATWDIAQIPSLRGVHNAQNAAAAAVAVAGRFAIDPAHIQSALRTFPGLPHRMENVRMIGHVLFVNDSKATNADSTEKALASFPSDIFWILGGQAKSGGIDPLRNYFSRVNKAYLIGEATDAFAAALHGTVSIERCGTLENAVATAARDAALSTAKEPIVLFSPACASFDQFRSFEHRGDVFRDLVVALPGLTP